MADPIEEGESAVMLILLIAVLGVIVLGVTSISGLFKSSPSDPKDKNPVQKAAENASATVASYAPWNVVDNGISGFWAGFKKAFWPDSPFSSSSAAVASAPNDLGPRNSDGSVPSWVMPVNMDSWGEGVNNEGL